MRARTSARVERHCLVPITSRHTDYAQPCARSHLEECIFHIVVLLAHLRKPPPLVNTALTAAAGKRCAGLRCNKQHVSKQRSSMSAVCLLQQLATQWFAAQVGRQHQQQLCKPNRCMRLLLVMVLLKLLLYACSACCCLRCRCCCLCCHCCCVRTSLRLSPTASSITLSLSACMAPQQGALIWVKLSSHA